MPNETPLSIVQTLFLERFRCVVEGIKQLYDVRGGRQAASASASNGSSGGTPPGCYGWLLWLSGTGIPKVLPALKWHVGLRQFAMQTLCDDHLMPLVLSLEATQPRDCGCPTHPDASSAMDCCSCCYCWIGVVVSILDCFATGQVALSVLPEKNEKRRSPDIRGPLLYPHREPSTPWPLSECAASYATFWQSMIRHVERALVQVESVTEKATLAGEEHEALSQRLIHQTQDDSVTLYASHGTAPVDRSKRMKYAGASHEDEAAGDQTIAPDSSDLAVTGWTFTTSGHDQLACSIQETTYLDCLPDTARRRTSPGTHHRDALQPEPDQQRHNIYLTWEPISHEYVADDRPAVHSGGSVSEPSCPRAERSWLSGRATGTGTCSADALSAISAASSPGRASSTTRERLHPIIGALIWRLVTSTATPMKSNKFPARRENVAPAFRASRFGAEQHRACSARSSHNRSAKSIHEGVSSLQAITDPSKRLGSDPLKSRSRKTAQSLDPTLVSDPSIQQMSTQKLSIVSVERSMYARVAALVALLECLQDRDHVLVSGAMHPKVYPLINSFLCELVTSWERSGNRVGLTALVPYQAALQQKPSCDPAGPFSRKLFLSIIAAILRGTVQDLRQTVHQFLDSSGDTQALRLERSKQVIQDVRFLQQSLEHIRCRMVDLEATPKAPNETLMEPRLSESTPTIASLLEADIHCLMTLWEQLETRHQQVLCADSHSALDIGTRLTSFGETGTRNQHSRRHEDDGDCAGISSSSSGERRIGCAPCGKPARSLPGSVAQRVAQLLFEVAQRRGLDASMTALHRFASRSGAPWLETLEVLLRGPQRIASSPESWTLWYKMCFELPRVFNSVERLAGKLLLDKFLKRCSAELVIDEQQEPALVLNSLRRYLEAFRRAESSSSVSGQRDLPSQMDGMLPDLERLTAVVVRGSFAAAQGCASKPPEMTWSVAETLFVNVLTPTLQPLPCWTPLEPVAGSAVLSSTQQTSCEAFQLWLTALEELAPWMPLYVLARRFQDVFRQRLSTVMEMQCAISVAKRLVDSLLAILQALDRGLAAAQSLKEQPEQQQHQRQVGYAMEPQALSLFRGTLLNMLLCGCVPIPSKDTPDTPVDSYAPHRHASAEQRSARCQSLRSALLVLVDGLQPLESAGPPIFFGSQFAATNRPQYAALGSDAAGPVPDLSPALYLDTRLVRQRLLWVYMRALCIWPRTASNETLRSRLLDTLSRLFAEAGTGLQLEPTAVNGLSSSRGSIVNSALQSLLEIEQRLERHALGSVAADPCALSRACDAAYVLWLVDEREHAPQDEAVQRSNLRKRLWRWELNAWHCEQRAATALNDLRDLESLHLFSQYLRCLVSGDHQRISLIEYLDGTLGEQLREALDEPNTQALLPIILPASLVPDFCACMSQDAHRRALLMLFWQHLYTATVAGGASIHLEGLPNPAYCEHVLLTYGMILETIEPQSGLSWPEHNGSLELALGQWVADGLPSGVTTNAVVAILSEELQRLVRRIHQRLAHGDQTPLVASACARDTVHPQGQEHQSGGS